MDVDPEKKSVSQTMSAESSNAEDSQRVYFYLARAGILCLKPQPVLSLI